MTTPHRSKQLQALLALLKSLSPRGASVTLAELASGLATSASTVSRLLNILIKDRRIERFAVPGHKAVYRVIDRQEGQVAASDETENQDDIPLSNASSGGVNAPPPSAPPSMAPQGSGDAERSPSTNQPPGHQFEAEQLDRMVISLPLQQFMVKWDEATATGATDEDQRILYVKDRTRIFGSRFSVIIDLNTGYVGGVARARQRVFDLLLLVEAIVGTQVQQGSVLDTVAPPAFRAASDLYVVARLTTTQIRKLVELDRGTATLPKSGTLTRRAIFRIWPDNVVRRQAYTALPTIKADAARNSFGCNGRDIVWAVVDSGIDGRHLHFATHRTLENLPAGVEHTDLVNPDHPAPLSDVFGHGTHVAGIIAGALVAQGEVKPTAVMYERDEKASRQPIYQPIDEITGVAPMCKLVSYKVLDDKGKGGVTEIMAALEDILRVNGYGKSPRIHGVNMSLGYTYDPQWFACGHSPLCEVVNRLARNGVCVVVAAGNSGFGYVDTLLAGTWAQGMPMSINDPGNAEEAITVGSTHRDAPHTYGVSFFSSKGPTGDGRCKPDVLAPGEKIISCRSTSVAPPGAGTVRQPDIEAADHSQYREDSGTSMATPHVSGAIAALLSVRREFIGRSADLKRIMLESALDLKRDRHMQGHGLVDLFSALQSI